MRTFFEILQDLRNRIIERIPVFDQGFPYARPDTAKDLTVTVGDETRQVSITDVEGDYFYLRVPNAITSSAVKARADRETAISQRYACSLVAVIKEADGFALADALVNELLKTKVIEVKATWIDPIAIVESEFKGLPRKSIESAKARLGGRVLVRVDFDIQRIFETHNCSYQICKPC